LFDTLKPTPELSFAVRHLNASGGIVITASHNPSEYNGYKIYDSRGCQYVPAMGEKVIEYVNEVEDVFSYTLANGCDSLISYIGTELDDAYMNELETIRLRKDVKAEGLKIVFTPLHGTSAVMGERVLKEFGYNYQCVTSQMVPDPDFTTVKSPNPEDKEAFKVAIEFANENGGDLIIATDPDADRLGIAVRKDGDFVLLTGNETGAILIDYILTTRKEFNTLPKSGVIYDTIVTSALGRSIGLDYNVSSVQTLTGFKFIGEQAYLIEGTEQEFVFGYEESYGYVIKDFVRDKDSLQAIIMICEAAAYYHNNNVDLLEKLDEIYEKYGYYTSETVSIKLEGKAGEERIQRIISSFRDGVIEEVNGVKVKVKEDYLTSKSIEDGVESDISLPKSNVLKFTLEDGSWFVLRPSGTEPKLKVYVEVKGTSKENGLKYLEQIKKDVLERVEKI
jgi:phosphoglucomutase